MSERTKIKIPEKNENLAEFVGIMLGDGSIFVNRDVSQVRIHGDLLQEKSFMQSFISNLVTSLFGIRPLIRLIPEYGEINACVNSVNLVRFLTSIGLISGHKIQNQVSIPKWILKSQSLLTACVRGLIDTDGSVFRMSKKDSDNPRIEFKNFNNKLLEDTRKSFIELGFHPSQITTGNHFFISRLEEVRRYSEEIKFHNVKHIIRLSEIAPWSSGQGSS